MGFWREVFSEVDGRGSFGRVSYGFVLFCILVFVGYQIYTKQVFSLDGWAWFAGSVGSTTYLGNKFATLKWGDRSVENKPQG
jgi:hypothetical protein